MKQHVQQPALQNAMHTVARYTKTGLEQFYNYDTDDSIQQQQADDNTSDLYNLQQIMKKNDNGCLVPLYMNCQNIHKYMLC